MQRLLHVRLSQLQFDKTKINIQTELRELISNWPTYVNLGLIGNKNGQRKRTQILLVIRNSHLQFDN